MLQVELEQVRAPRRSGEPVIASVASVRGREAMLEDAVASLLPQVDRLHVYLNNYSETPGFLEDPGLSPYAQMHMATSVTPASSSGSTPRMSQATD